MSEARRRDTLQFTLGGVLPLFDRNDRLPVFLGDALDRGAVVLTANLRAARALEAAHAEDQRSRSILAWPKPLILDWNTWVAARYEQYARRQDDAPIPLSSLQEHQLWKQVQGADRGRVVVPDRLADLAQEAYGLLGGYSAHPLRQMAGTGLFAEMQEDAERFLVWADNFDRRCRQNGWISRSRLPETVAASVHLLEAVPEVCLVGFDRNTPAQASLLGAQERSGTRITRFQPSSVQAKPALLEAKDQRQELEACAWWCRSRLLEDSSLRLGVIAPDLGRVRADLDRVFRRILMPQTTLWPGTDDSARLSSDPPSPYEFSLGVSLGTLPLIRAALLLLRWVNEPVAAAELTWLLTSGVLADSRPDALALARLDAELRRTSGPEVALDWLLDQRPRSLSAALRGRLGRVQAFGQRERLRGRAAPDQDRNEPAPGRQHGTPERRASYAHWAELVPGLLREFGWPGFREADSFTYQTGQRWARLLAEVAELSFDGSLPPWNQFLDTLGAHAYAVIFAAESSAAPIQVLGAFESSGQSFDAVWFLGTDDAHWPATGRLHPLLPAWMQREAAMPHASPEADWLLAQETTARIVASAPVVVLSHAATDQGAQAVALRASPLILNYAARAGEMAGASKDAAPRLQDVALEAVADDSGMLAWPASQNAGGAEVLRHQAACAFQSFAMRRLEARPLEETAPGLDAAERGTALHAVLERLWSADENDPERLHTRDDLQRATVNGSVTAMLANHIRAVFAPLLEARRGDRWNEAYLACEQQRVQQRVEAWLVCERERQPFAVAAVEKKVAEMLVGALRLAVRLDRVDRLADGTHLLIDYKTGKVQTSAWMGERPEEPQLPLYAVFGGIAEVSGVAFAQIRADETKIMARASSAFAQVSEELGAPSEKIRLDDEVMDGWRDALLALADQFVRGEAQVNPRDGARTCKYCPLAGLCRVHAAGLLTEEEEGAAHE